VSATASALETSLPQALEVLARLRAMPYAQLQALPSHDTKEISALGRRVPLTTYADVLEKHGCDIQVVVQLVAHGRLGFSRVWARGFRMSIQSESRGLLEKELYEYS